MSGISGDYKIRAQKCILGGIINNLKLNSMKYVYLLVLSLILFFSCSKSGNSNNSNGSLLVSVTEYQTAPFITKTVRNFTYDQNQELGAVHTHTYDTVGGQAFLDTSLITYPSNSATTPPASYDITWVMGSVNPAQGATEHHLLYYDGQSRIVKDSISSKTDISNPTPKLYTTNFIYANSNIIVQYLYQNPSGPDINSMVGLDTFMLANGNLSNTIQYNVVPLDTGFYRSDSYLYSPSKNPLYESTLANRLGAALRFNNIGDFISPYLMSQWTMNLAGNNQFTRNYNWVTDSLGRVVQGFGTYKISGQVTDYWTFQY